MPDTPLIELPPPALSAAALARLREIFGESNLAQGTAERIAYSQDRWTLSLVWTREGRVPYPPDAVCWAERTEQVAALLALAARERFAVVPYGAGSGVCGGTLPLRGGVVVDLKKMNRVTAVREEALLCEAEAGIIGQHLEEALNRRGYTLGHFPSSIYCSTLGGWLAARSAGQASTKYGKIEDLCAGLEVVLPSGEVAVQKPMPRAAVGPDWKQLLIGSEGTLGVITRAWLRISPLPEARRFLAFKFPTVRAGLAAIRKVLRRGFRPAVVRLYDPFDTLLGVAGGGGARGPIEQAKKAVMERAKLRLLAHPEWAAAIERVSGGCHAVFVCEGDRELVAVEAAAVEREALAEGAEPRGPEPAEHWMRHRYDVSYKGAPLFREGAFVDTMEVAAPWDRVEALYDAVHAALAPRAVTLAHFSHAYADGCSIYFTFAALLDDDAATEARYRACWEAGLEAALAVGATISHHHGVGLLKGPFMRREWGAFQDVYAAVKKAIDPAGVLNPGKMGLA
jgi:alkyldihydroxyacetonephosphate synthase